MKKQLLLILCLLSISINYAQTFNDGVLEYTVTSGTDVSVKKFNNICPTGNLTIPSTIVDSGTTYTITSILNQAFINCSGLTSLTIPNSVTSIGYSAFWNCSGLTNLTIPNSVTSIEHTTFENCSGLTSLTIPNSITSIGYNAFENCSGLTSLTIPNSVTSIENSAFWNCSGLISLTIPNSVTTIEYSTFEFCSGLTSLTIPNSITSIGDYAFNNCSGLTNLTIPNSVTSIGDYAFFYCSGLTNLTIPNSVTSIGDFAFVYCSSLTSVTVNWATPLIVPSNIFLDVNVSAIPLTVPAGTVALYQAATVWQDFGSFVLSTEDFTENNISVQLYPNPVKDQLNITLNNNLSLKGIQVYNNLGQLIKKSNIGTIDVSDLQGVYFAKIITDKGNVTKRIIVE